MEDYFGVLPEELIELEERQDLSQYSYDPNDKMESVNSDVALNYEPSQPSSQDKLFDSDFLWTESDQNPGDDTRQLDVLDLLGLSGQLLTTLPLIDTGLDQPTLDSKPIVVEPTSSEFVDNDDSSIQFDETSTLPDSTMYSNIEFAELEPSPLSHLLPDKELLLLSTRDLNRKIRNMSQHEQQQIKNRRRTLKNRGYAQTCRTRRVGQRHQLESDNNQLNTEVKKLKQDNGRLVAECERLRKEGTQYKSERDAVQNRLQLLVDLLAENGVIVQ